MQKLGTPQHSEWEAVCDKKQHLGVTGTFLFPMFRPQNEKPWGVKYGSEFVGFIAQMLKVKPPQRASANIVLCSRWHSGPTITHAAMVASAIQGCFGMELVAKVEMSQWPSAENMNIDSNIMAIAFAIMILVFAWLCYCCYCGNKMGRQKAALTSDDADEYFVMPSGKKIHLYKDCHTLDKVRVKEMEACSFCHGRRVKEVAKKT